MVGIKDKKEEPTILKRWDGLKNIEEFDIVFQAIHELRPVPKYSYRYLSTSEFPGYVLRIDIPKSESRHLCPDGKIFIRRGSQCIEISQQRPLTLKDAEALAGEYKKTAESIAKHAEDLTRMSKKGDHGVSFPAKDGGYCLLRVFDADENNPRAIQAQYADGVIGYVEIHPEELRRYHKHFFPKGTKFSEHTIDLSDIKSRELNEQIVKKARLLGNTKATLNICCDTNHKTQSEESTSSILVSIQQTIMKLYASGADDEEMK